MSYEAVESSGEIAYTLFFVVYFSLFGPPDKSGPTVLPKSTNTIR